MQSFYTLTGQAVRLWRSLTALQTVVERVMPHTCKKEASEARVLNSQCPSIFTIRGKSIYYPRPEFSTVSSLVLFI